MPVFNGCKSDSPAQMPVARYVAPESHTLSVGPLMCPYTPEPLLLVVQGHNRAPLLRSSTRKGTKALLRRSLRSLTPAAFRAVSQRRSIATLLHPAAGLAAPDERTSDGRAGRAGAAAADVRGEGGQRPGRGRERAGDQGGRRLVRLRELLRGRAPPGGPGGGAGRHGPLPPERED